MKECLNCKWYSTRKTIMQNTVMYHDSKCVAMPTPIDIQARTGYGPCAFWAKNKGQNIIEVVFSYMLSKDVVLEEAVDGIMFNLHETFERRPAETITIKFKSGKKSTIIGALPEKFVWLGKHEVRPDTNYTLNVEKLQDGSCKVKLIKSK